MPDRIRTYDLRIRSPLLYPAELQAHVIYLSLFPFPDLDVLVSGFPFFFFDFRGEPALTMLPTLALSMPLIFAIFHSFSG